jgi:hypothetical protein
VRQYILASYTCIFERLRIVDRAIGARMGATAGAPLADAAIGRIVSVGTGVTAETCIQNEKDRYHTVEN